MSSVATIIGGLDADVLAAHRRRRDRLGIAGVFAVAAGLLAVSLVLGQNWSRWFGPGGGTDPRIVARVVFGWKTWAGVGLLLILEHVAPADPDQPLFGPSVLRDATFTVAKFGCFWWLLYGYLSILTGFLDAHVAWLHPAALDRIPRWMAVVLAYAIADGLAWWHHRLRHKGWLWRFHAVHHSATRMNAFTDDRAHPFELFLGGTIVAIPLYVFSGASHLEVALVSYALGWFTRFVHCNIRTDLGPFRYLFVSPRSHLVHHSIEPEHADRNFGVVFSVWDRMFGTHVDVEGRLPATGVNDDAHHAAEEEPHPLRSFARLMTAPFAHSAR